MATWFVSLLRWNGAREKRTRRTRCRGFENTQSCSTTLSSELCTCIQPPSHSTNPSFRNLFIKKLTRERVVPIISASDSWLILGITSSGLSSLPKIPLRRFPSNRRHCSYRQLNFRTRRGSTGDAETCLLVCTPHGLRPSCSVLPAFHRNALAPMTCNPHARYSPWQPPGRTLQTDS